MSAPQTKRELPKKGASTRLAAISTPSSTAPPTKTAMPTANALTRTAGAACGNADALAMRPRATHELLERGRELDACGGPGDEHGVPSGALEGDDLFAVQRPCLRDHELSRRNIGQEVERA